jgi:hypothetical protein
LVDSQRFADFGSQLWGLSDPRNNGAKHYCGFNDQATGSVSSNDDPFSTFEKLADTDTAAIVNIEDYRLRFHAPIVPLTLQSMLIQQSCGTSQRRNSVEPSAT